MEQIPLNHEASDGDTNKQSTSTLPNEVVQCLENARFLHLATCVDNVPHVSLMNYTYLPATTSSAANTPSRPSPVIVMTTNPASKKTHNIVANPNVSLLVHDWVSHRPLTRRLSGASDDAAAAAADGGSSRRQPSPGGFRRTTPLEPGSSPPEPELGSCLVYFCTINGTARLLPQGSSEESYYRQQHLAHNTFDADPVGPDEMRIHQQIAHATPGGGNAASATATSASQSNDPRPADGRDRFVAGEEVRVIVVDIHDVRISDWKGHVRDWVLVPSVAPTVNGV